MDINDFLIPVELDTPPAFHKPDEFSFSRTINIHTPDHPISDLHSFDLAILGIPEDRSSYNKGSSDAPSKIREKLYQLRGFQKNIKIIDLGNLKPGIQVKDTYYGANEVFDLLNKNNIAVLVLGGSQDVTISSCMAMKKINQQYRLMTLDRKIDYQEITEHINSDNYLHAILYDSPDYCPLEISCVGYQTYLVNDSMLDLFRNKHHKMSRLGMVRSNIHLIEPQVRDSHILSIDISSIKQADAPGFFNPSPNGFYGEEVCQIARYAGLGENISTFGIYEVNPNFDINTQTSHLAAQICWYFIEGFSQRANEHPSKNKEAFKKFIVAVSKLEQQMVFYKSQKTNRWWMQIPADSEKFQNKFIIVACSSSDYEIACEDEIPDRYLEAFHRFN